LAWLFKGLTHQRWNRRHLLNLKDLLDIPPNIYREQIVKVVSLPKD
jgi:hypothetical protein